MKILYVITGLGMGGAEAITIDIANVMSARGHEVAIMYLTGENLQMHRLNPNLKVIGLEMQKTPIGLLFALYRAHKWINKFSPDIVHGQMVHANFFCRVLRLFCRIPYLICTEHNKNIEGKMRMWLYQFTDRLSDLNTNVSEEATSYFISKKAFNPSKTITMYNGVDLSKYVKDTEQRETLRKNYDISSGEFLFLNIGRLTKAKDQETLIKAFSILCEKGLLVKLMIVGKGDEENTLRKLISNLALSDRGLLAGAHNDGCPCYSKSDCFVLSSLWEGFPMVLIEAMSMELPVVTTECGREAINDEKYVCPSHDAKLLADKMISMYQISVEDRKGIGRVNRNKALRFDLNRVCDQWERIYSHSDKVLI